MLTEWEQSADREARHALHERVKVLEAELARALEALRGWIDFANEQGMPVSLSDLEAAQLTGGKDA